MAVTSFIPTIWSARLNDALQKSHVAGNLVNRDYEGEIKNVGDKVKINTISDITIGTYTRNVDISAPEALSTVASTLEINQAKYFNFQVDDIDAVQSAGDLIDKAMANASYGLADASDKYLLGVMASGANAENALADATITTGDLAYTTILSLRIKLDKANVPTEGRFIVVPPEMYAMLLQDNRFVAGGGSQAEEAVRSGFIGRVAGFDVYESNNLPVSTGKTTIVASVPSSTTYAEQILKTEAYRPEGRFADAVKGLHVYGALVTNDKAIATVKATFGA